MIPGDGLYHMIGSLGYYKSNFHGVQIFVGILETRKYIQCTHLFLDEGSISKKMLVIY